MRCWWQHYWSKCQLMATHKVAIATGPVQRCVSCLGLPAVDERRVATEEGDHLLHCVILIVTGRLDEESLPGDSAAWKHLVQEHCARLQLLVTTGGLVVKLNTTTTTTL